jgi:hypothetical protein
MILWASLLKRLSGGCVRDASDSGASRGANPRGPRPLCALLSVSASAPAPQTQRGEG